MIFFSGRQPLLLASIAGLVLMSLIWVAAAGGNDDRPQYGGSYVEGVVGHAERINPLFASNSVEQDLATLIFSGLTRPGRDGAILPDLARAWDITDDGKTYTFHLRSGVFWHDGRTFSADDVVFTAGILSSSDYSGDPTIAAMWKGVKATRLDDLTVRFELPQPFAPFLSATTIGILPRHLLDNQGPREIAASSFNETPIGTGPFRLDRLASDGARLSAYRRYHLGPPYLDRIGVRFYDNDADLAGAMAAGQVQGGLLAPDKTSADAGGNPMSIYRLTTSAYVTLYLNQRAVLFVDQRVRQAIDLAIDRKAIVDEAIGGRGVVAASPIPPGSWAATGEPPRQDLDRSKRLMEEAGWLLDNGVWKRGGIEMRFNILTNPDSDRTNVGETLAKQLRAAGFFVSVAVVESEQLIRDYLRPRQFAATLFGFDPGVDPDPYPAWHSSQSGSEGANIASYASADADRALEAGRLADSEEKRRQAYADFQTRFMADAPSVVLYYPSRLYAVDSGIQGIDPGILFRPDSRLFDIATWHRENGIQ